MPEPEATAHVHSCAQTRRRAGEPVMQPTGAPLAEEAAAIVAVLTLLQAEAPPGTAAPRVSAWAQAGRREALRPWKRQA